MPNAGNNWDGKFITSGSSPWDWLSPQNDNLWQGGDADNNPCPPGWRVPTEAELVAELESWVTQDAAGAYGSPLKLPVAGGRMFGDGSLDFVGGIGYYWSSAVLKTNARALRVFSTNNPAMGNSGRAYGYSVRCLKN